jgi:hypothetical protein
MKALFSYFFALSLLFLDIDACDFKSFDFCLSHFNHAFCLFTSIYNVLLNYASATSEQSFTGLGPEERCSS